MKLRFSKRDKWILTAAIILIILVFFYAQFILIAPLKSDLALKQQSLKTEQQLLDKTEQKKAVPAVLTADYTRALQEKVPVKPLEDQLILDLEKAESLSNSQIKSMTFSKDVQVNTATNPAGQGTAQPNTNGGQPSAGTGQQNPPQAQPAVNQTVQNQGNTGAATPGTATPPVNHPAQQTTAGTAAAAQSGLKKLTVQLSVESPSYEEFEKFIGTIESLQRIVVVENISYSGGQEVTSISQAVKPLAYSLTISTFYMSGLTDLQPGLPKMDAPAPADKQNPLSTISNVTP